MLDVWLNGLPGDKNTKTTKMNRDKTSFSIGKSEKYRKISNFTKIPSETTKKSIGNIKLKTKFRKNYGE